MKEIYNQNTDNESLTWRVCEHANGLLKIETKDRVIFDGFAGEEKHAYLAASAPRMREALINCMHALIAMGKGPEDKLLCQIGAAIRDSFPRETK